MVASEIRQEIEMGSGIMEKELGSFPLVTKDTRKHGRIH